MNSPLKAAPRDHFSWGAATSAYQIEGAFDQDGKGPSIWDKFTEQKKAKNGATGREACDHYHRLEQDIGLMRELGLNGYRFSLSWPRIIPKGTGEINHKGLDWYDRLIDALLAANIEPFVTLYHWDLPQALQDRRDPLTGWSGWENPDVADWFAEYAGVVARRFCDRVKTFFTLNEPTLMAPLGYLDGAHAPGIRDVAAMVRVIHHQVLAHEKGRRAIKAASLGIKVGAAFNYSPHYPASDSPEDSAVAARVDDFANHQVVGALMGRGYPAWLLERYAELGAGYKAMERYDNRSQTLDVVGINYYSPCFKQAGDSIICKARDGNKPIGDDLLRQGLLDSLRELSALGAPEIVITENGLGTPGGWETIVMENGCPRVHDADRVHYLRNILLAVEQALDEQLPLTGYFVWSLLDNFEWAEGYTRRYGLYHIDWNSPLLPRTAKDSALFYRDYIRCARIHTESGAAQRSTAE